MNNFVVALGQLGFSAERYLTRSQLPVGLVENSAGNEIVSAINMLDFAEQSSLGTGVLDLGLRAGAMRIEGYGEFGAHVAQAATLHEAIQTFCCEVKGECSAADYTLTPDGAKAWFCHGPSHDSPLLKQHELYAFSIMLQVIRLAMGSDWCPARIRLQTKDKVYLSDNDCMRNTDVEFGSRTTAIELPLRCLATPLKNTTDSISLGNVPGTDRFPAQLPADPMIALQRLISSFIQHSQQPTIELTAESIGVSKRSLQRFLNSKATSYSKLIDRTRFDMAVPLLSDSSLTVTEISAQLGYSNIAHFSRAFRRITGMSPRSYRHNLKQQ